MNKTNEDKTTITIDASDFINSTIEWCKPTSIAINNEEEICLICPLMSVATFGMGNSFAYCVREKCALWDGDKCAFRSGK